MSAEEFQRLLRHASPAFRRLLIAARHTGCRPDELRKLCWEQVDLDRGLWIIPEHKTSTTQRDPKPRIVPLPLTLIKLCRWLARTSRVASDHVFLNEWKQPYRKDRFAQTFRRLRKRAGLDSKGGEQVVMYTNRHTFGSEASGRISDFDLKELMGHTDLRTTQRYVHFNP